MPYRSNVLCEFCYSTGRNLSYTLVRFSSTLSWLSHYNRYVAFFSGIFIFKCFFYVHPFIDYIIPVSSLVLADGISQGKVRKIVLLEIFFRSLSDSGRLPYVGKNFVSLIFSEQKKRRFFALITFKVCRIESSSSGLSSLTSSAWLNWIRLYSPWLVDSQSSRFDHERNERAFLRPYHS